MIARIFSSALFLALFLTVVPGVAPAASVSVDCWDGSMTYACTDGGTTIIVGSETGKLKRLTLTFINNGASDVTISAPSISNLVGCVVPLNGFSAAVATAGGGTCLVQMGVRPTAATWSFRVAFTIQEPGGSTAFTQTVSQSGIMAGTGVQVGLTLPFEYSQPWEFPSLTLTPYWVTDGDVLEYRVKLTSRSAVQDQVFTPPGWLPAVPGSTGLNCSFTIDDQPPSTLSLDQDWITTFRVTTTAPGVYEALFSSTLTDHGTVRISGTASIYSKLRAFHAGRQIAVNKPTIPVSGSTIGAAIPLTFVLRNDEPSSVTFTRSCIGTGCTVASTFTSSSATYVSGEQKNWEVTITPTASEWSCSMGLYAGRPINWIVKNLEPASAPAGGGGSTGSGGGSSDSGSSCGTGSGIGVLLLLILVLTGACLRSVRPLGVRRE